MSKWNPEKWNLQIHTWDELLDAIIKRPGMFVGNRSIDRIGIYLDGYVLCARFHLPDWDDTYREFEEFVWEEYEIDIRRWFDVINFYSTTEQDAFDNFVKMVNKFRATQQNE